MRRSSKQQRKGGSNVGTGRTAMVVLASVSVKDPGWGVQEDSPAPSARKPTQTASESLRPALRTVRLDCAVSWSSGMKMVMPSRLSLPALPALPATKRPMSCSADMSLQSGYDLPSRCVYWANDDNTGWLLACTADKKSVLSELSGVVGWQVRKSVVLWYLRRSTIASFVSVKETGCRD